MDKVTVDQVVANFRNHLHLSKETENEILAEVRSHLEDAVARAVIQGGNEELALLKAAEEFGVDEAGVELQEIHSERESTDAIVATALPILFALILRWLTYAPDGSPRDWPLLLVQPGFYIVAVCSLLFPALCLRRWRFALVGWGVFWLLTVVFVVFPSINRW